jgi:predicted dehydrogenase
VRRAADAYGVESIYTDHRVMLTEQHPDGVVIVTHHATHYALAVDCLDAGCHLLIEKPMTLRAADARDLVRRAYERERTITIGYTSNFHPHAERARNIMRSGALGKPQFVAGTMVSRVVDFLRGERPSGMDGLFPVHGPGTVYSQPELSGGGQGHLQLTHLVGLLTYVADLRARRVSAFMVHCESGGLLLDISQGTLSVRGPDGMVQEHGPPNPPFAGHPVPSQQFVAGILGRPSLQASGDIGWRAVEILDAAYRSAQKDGKPVTIESLYE